MPPCRKSVHYEEAGAAPALGCARARKTQLGSQPAANFGTRHLRPFLGCIQNFSREYIDSRTILCTSASAENTCTRELMKSDKPTRARSENRSLQRSILPALRRVAAPIGIPYARHYSRISSGSLIRRPSPPSFARRCLWFACPSPERKRSTRSMVPASFPSQGGRARQQAVFCNDSPHPFVG